MQLETYYTTFSSAVQAARQDLERRGFTITEDEWFNEISTGPSKPSAGNTNRYSLELWKDGKVQRKCAQIQVYNRGTQRGTYELNYYIN